MNRGDSDYSSRLHHLYNGKLSQMDRLQKERNKLRFLVCKIEAEAIYKEICRCDEDKGVVDQHMAA